MQTNVWKENSSLSRLRSPLKRCLRSTFRESSHAFNRDIDFSCETLPFHADLRVTAPRGSRGHASSASGVRVQRQNVAVNVVQNRWQHYCGPVSRRSLAELHARQRISQIRGFFPFSLAHRRPRRRPISGKNDFVVDEPLACGSPRQQARFRVTFVLRGKFLVIVQASVPICILFYFFFFSEREGIFF